MNLRTVTLDLPESIYLRMEQAAQATKQSINDIFLRVLQVGSPPDWKDAPAEFQAELAALDRLDDGSLWRIARACKSESDFERYQDLLDRNSEGTITETERGELNSLRREADCFMLRKAHAASLLRWRGHQIPPADRF